MGNEVRSSSTIPSAADFVSGRGTPLVVNRNTGRGYVILDDESIVPIGGIGRVNLLDYGAKGDGVTDDSTAIAAAEATGKPIYAPAGTYVVNQSTAPQGVLGDGIGVTIFKVKDNSAISSQAVFHLTENTSGYFSGFTIDGNSANNVNFIHGIMIRGSSSHVTVEDVRCVNMPGNTIFGGDAVYIGTTGSHIKVARVSGSNIARIGLTVVRGTDIQIEHVEFSNCGRAGILMEKNDNAHDIKRVTIDGVLVDTVGTVSIAGSGMLFDGAASGSNYFEDLVVSNVVLRGSKYYGIDMRGVRNAIFSNVVSYGHATVGSGAATGNIRLISRCQNVTFLGGRFVNADTGNSDYGIDVRSDADTFNINLVGVELDGNVGELLDPDKKIRLDVRNNGSARFQHTSGGNNVWFNLQDGQIRITRPGSAPNLMFHDGTDALAMLYATTTFQVRTQGSIGHVDVADTSGTARFRVATAAPGSGEAAVLVTVNDGAVTSLRQVTVGAVDSGGTGYRLLRVPN